MNDDMKMYRNDDEAHEAAMNCFEGEDTPARLPALYPTDEASYDAALRYFEGVR
ncbi:MAG: hypothetical protein ACYCS8_04835 [Acidithiobacillus sp.]